jgi:hypothetical protein
MLLRIYTAYKVCSCCIGRGSVSIYRQLYRRSISTSLHRTVLDIYITLNISLYKLYLEEESI